MSDQTRPAEAEDTQRDAAAMAGDAREASDAPDASAAQPEPQAPAPRAAAPPDADVLGAKPGDQVGVGHEGEQHAEVVAEAEETRAEETRAEEPAANQVGAEEAEAAPAHEAEADAAHDGDADDGDADDDDDDDDEPAMVAPMGPIEEISDEELAEDINIDWYILKVQSNRERTSAEALKRKVAIEGLDRYFGDIIVPTEKVTEFKNGKKKTVERKIWPGYIAVQMHVNDDTWFAIRETSGIGDFTGAAGKPVPMTATDVEKILPKEEGEESEDDTPKLNIKFAEGDKVKVTDGNFENFEGEVDAIDQQSGKITVMISIFGRSTPVELEYWQVEKL
ncbi:transcription termination/antitermination protein NusG [Botrimarina sp.]|uniref:transcription termination/antitermination protein NusG n=1 Tax=Botrimarina sp. TaxID=2795802 RepID=UPI0032EAA638